MEQSNGAQTAVQKKNILFSIGSYNAKEPRVINKISANGLFSAADSPPPMPATWTMSRSRPVSLDLTDDAASRRNGYSTLPRMKTHSHLHLNGGGPVEKPSCPPSSSSKYRCERILENRLIDKPLHPPTNYKRSMSLEPEQLHHSGRVALTVAAYEGEPRTPTRLEFLPPTSRLSRSSSKASSHSSTPVEDVQTMNSRLQNELSATLLRSNLRNKNDQDATSATVQENGESSIIELAPSKEETKEESQKDFQKEDKDNNNITVDDEFKFTNGNVKKLAIVLNEKMTFKADPEIS